MEHFGHGFVLAVIQLAVSLSFEFLSCHICSWLQSTGKCGSSPQPKQNCVKQNVHEQHASAHVAEEEAVVVVVDEDGDITDEPQASMVQNSVKQLVDTATSLKQDK